MPMTTLTTPIEPFALKHTNVSNPSIVHKPSQHSITASEDYYSLSNSASSTHTLDQANPAAQSADTLRRYQTPPSRYRTPNQSRDYLPYQGPEAGPVKYEDVDQVRRTPMRGPGKRRQSDASSGEEQAYQGAAAMSAGGHGRALREGGIRRKAIPSVITERSEGQSPRSHEDIDPSHARSSVAQDFDRDQSPPTPGVDDTPYIRFALDQLTRDEEVRGSRFYVDDGSLTALPQRSTWRSMEAQRPQVAPGAWPSSQRQSEVPVEAPEVFDEPPPRNPLRQSLAIEPAMPGYAEQRPTFEQSRHSPAQPQAQGPPSFLSAEEQDILELSFVPGVLRPLQLGIFVLFVLAYFIILLTGAIYSLSHDGISRYRAFGDARYFVFQYFPTLLAVVVFLWLVQIMVAVYRIAPFIAMASHGSATPRERGATLPMYPAGFVLPYLGHLGAGQMIIGIFMVVAWLQLFTIPLLATSFNVHYYTIAGQGQWRWTATQGAIWVAVVLYALLIVTVVTLAVWLSRQQTGLRWDPRSLADLIVLLERSNALESHDVAMHEPPRLGYWRSSVRRNDVFHTYGIEGKAARTYGVEDGRIREQQTPPPLLTSRFSIDGDMENGTRGSREKFLPRPTHYRESEDGSQAGHHSNALPWFLHPTAAALWIIAALFLLLAFLIVSYLPSTRVSKGFSPDVPAPVSTDGFSSTNFLYSFLPALLGTLCLLSWLDIDYAHRRLQPYISLAFTSDPTLGALAEHSLLLSYPAEPPFLVTASALVNKHFRLALITLTTLLAATLPVLAGGVFWAQFYIAKQRTLISAHMPAYYALTVFVVLYALSYILIFPSRTLRNATSSPSLIPAGNKLVSFADVIDLVRQSRMLDDVAFHAPASKTDLVTRLLSSPPPGGRNSYYGDNEAAATSKVSLVADSVRGFGKARQKALVGWGQMAEQRFRLGLFVGRGGRRHVGIDRVREGEKF